MTMRSFLNQLESDRVTKLCSAVDSDERLFWKLLKGQKSSSQMSAFLVNGSLITDINAYLVKKMTYLEIIKIR